MVANVNGPAPLVNPAAWPSTSHSLSGCAANASWPVHSVSSVIRSFPTCRESDVAQLAGRSRKLVSYPIAHEIIRASIYQRPDASLEKCRDIDLVREHVVHTIKECCVHCHVGATEIGGDRRVYAECRAHVRPAQVGCNIPGARDSSAIIEKAQAEKTFPLLCNGVTERIVHGPLAVRF